MKFVVSSLKTTIKSIGSIRPIASELDPQVQFFAACTIGRLAVQERSVDAAWLLLQAVPLAPPGRRQLVAAAVALGATPQHARELLDRAWHVPRLRALVLWVAFRWLESRRWMRRLAERLWREALKLREPEGLAQLWEPRPMAVPWLFHGVSAMFSHGFSMALEPERPPKCRGYGARRASRA